MSFRAAGKLERYGLTRERFSALAELIARHRHEARKGGQHCNGGCHDGRCDFGVAACAAWTELLDIVARNLPEVAPAPAEAKP